MRGMIPGPVLAMFFVGATAGAAHAQVCVEIDVPRDMLDPQDRAAAVLLLTRQFALAGEEVAADCATPYLLAHVRLGNTITVTLSGPKGTREGVALGLDDLPALYSQMVRSLETGRPMTGLGVVDRTNVTAAQASAQRVHSDAFAYARLGYSGIVGNRVYGMPAFGFGYRAELDSMAIDVSFINMQVGSSDYYGSRREGRFAAQTIGIVSGQSTGQCHTVLRRRPELGQHQYQREPTLYRREPDPGLSEREPPLPTRLGPTAADFKAKLTAGYEFGRATTIRMFVQADAVLPFYSVTSQTFSQRSRHEHRASLCTLVRDVGGAGVAAKSEIEGARPERVRRSRMVSDGPGALGCRRPSRPHADTARWDRAAARARRSRRHPCPRRGTAVRAVRAPGRSARAEAGRRTPPSPGAPHGEAAVGRLLVGEERTEGGRSVRKECRWRRAARHNSGRRSGFSMRDPYGEES